jgi:hypothetical protein
MARAGTARHQPTAPTAETMDKSSLESIKWQVTIAPDIDISGLYVRWSCQLVPPKCNRCRQAPEPLAHQQTSAGRRTSLTTTAPTVLTDKPISTWPPPPLTGPPDQRSSPGCIITLFWEEIVECEDRGRTSAVLVDVVGEFYVAGLSGESGIGSHGVARRLNAFAFMAPNALAMPQVRCGRYW